MQSTLPVTILTGFLGSGKTTILNHLLCDPRLTDTAIIVNEFGEIGLDHLLVGKAVDQAVLMDNGCLCCSIRGDLTDTLLDLLDKVARGEIPPFGRVIVETTGLANPGPIVETLLTDPELSSRFRLKGTVVTLDAVAGLDTLKRHDEAKEQLAMADLVLLTKTDLPDSTPGAIEAAARMINPEAPMIRTAAGVVDPERILAVEAVTTPHCGCGHDHGHAHEHHHDHDHDHAKDHAWNIDSAAITWQGPQRWDDVAGWLEWLASLRGPDLLRVKGILEIEGCEGPVLVQAVQTSFSEPVTLPDWPDADRRSRIVLIARDIPAAALERSFHAYLGAKAA